MKMKMMKAHIKGFNASFLLRDGNKCTNHNRKQKTLIHDICHTKSSSVVSLFCKSMLKQFMK